MNRNRQRGAALITAMLIVSLVTVATVAMTSRMQINLRRTENILYTDQAMLYVDGAEEWAKQILSEDSLKNQTDSEKDDWATILPPIPIDGGTISGKIEDLQGRFNLNNLVRNNVVSTVDVQRFKRLLTNVDLSDQLSAAVIDWLDSNEDLTLPGGAEDNTYLQQVPARRAANRAMQSPAELLDVYGFDLESYRKLEPFITALPDFTDINVNTISAEVLTALVDGLSLDDAKKIIESRGKEGFAKIDDLFNQQALQGKSVVKNGLSVSSQYFQVEGTVIIGRTHTHAKSILQRTQTGKVLTVQRSIGG